MSDELDLRETFDAALIPGMRDRLADAYARFRAQEAEMVRALAPAGAGSADSYRERNCPCCGIESSGLPAVLHAHGLDLVQCPGCELTYSRQVLDEAADAARYAHSALDPEAMRLRGSPPYLELETARDRYYLARMMDGGAWPGRLLEVGCGTGTLLLEAERLGWRALGIEPGEAAVEVARKRGATVVQGWFPDDLPIAARDFESICVLDVLEHFADPIGFLHQLRAHLTHRGRVLVQVPNWDSLLVRLQGAASSTVCPGHWSYFTARTLTTVLSRAGFRKLSLETVISELDRIAEYPEHQVRTCLARLRPGAPGWPLGAAALHDLTLGYKLVGVFELGPALNPASPR